MKYKRRTWLILDIFLKNQGHCELTFSQISWDGRHKKELEQMLNLYVRASHFITCENQCDSDLLGKHRYRSVKVGKYKCQNLWEQEFFSQTYPISLLGIYLGKIIIQKDTCTPMFTAVLFTIARTWKQHKCLLTDEWIKKMCIQTMEHYSVIKRNETGSFVVTWMDLESVIQSEVRKKKQISYIYTYVWNQNKNGTDKAICCVK